MSALHGSRRRQRGVSLIEALVALAVMAFGMLGVVGMQATLRTGADQSKQRSEAVRLAQEEMERLRAFGQLASAPSGEHTYALIGPAAAASVYSSTNTLYQANTTFQRSLAVVDHVASAASAPRMKTVTVDVSWRDRDYDATLANERSVTLRSIVAEIPPVLAGSLGVPYNRSAPQRPGGRNINIPRSNTQPGSGDTTVFTPPGGGGVTWVFDNTTGLITSTCTAAVPPVCTAANLALISGYIRFATDAQPTAAEAELPSDPVPPALAALGVIVNYSDPAPGGDVSSASGGCFVGPPSPSNYLQYFCAMPLAFVGFKSNNTWTGVLDLVLPTGTLANDIGTDNAATRYRVCRYTADHTTDAPAGGNEAHPLTYTAVSGSLSNQNFLVISAGDGSSAAFTCPVDNIANLVNASTRLHLPSVPPR
jgi:Tfp pilus assembly protein PilV